MSMNTKRKIPAVAVVGPTASGKTALAVEIALQYNGEVISADSMQIYKDMTVASAAPSPEEMKGVPHHLLEFSERDISFSVSDFVALATEAALGISKRGRLPVLAGGTGLYINSLIYNYTFTESSPNAELRQRLQEKYEQQGGQKLLEELQKIDSQAAARLHPNDKKRIIRAFEIYELCGSTVTRQTEQSRSTPSPFDFFMIGLTYADRQKLYDRINARVDRMLEKGLEAEARRAFESNLCGTGSQAIGHKEFFEYFEGRQSYEKAVERIKTETRHLAKRQLTWFNRNPDIHWIYADRCDNVAGEAYKILEQNGFKV